MTDWERVEKLRAKGLDWQSIAEDEKVGFRAEVTAGSSGRALKALYLERRSRRRRTGRSAPDAPESENEDSKKLTRLTNRFIGAGIVIALLGAVWWGVVYGFPNAGVLTPFPDLLFVIVAGLVLLGLALVLGGSFRDFTAWRKVIVGGIALGLVAAGGVSLYSVVIGIPVLHPITNDQVGGNWSKAGGNSLWTESGHPVVFFLGSVACPFCSASSWAIYGALQSFGSWSGTQYGTSNPGDVWPGTAEIEFPGASFSSNLLSVDFQEGNNPNQISTPGLTPTENAYVTTYDGPTGSIPFLVVGGIWIHGGSASSLVNPAVLHTNPSNSQSTAYSVQQVSQAISSLQGPIYQAVEYAQLYFEAALATACKMAHETPPASVTSNPTVAQYMLAME